MDTSIESILCEELLVEILGKVKNPRERVSGSLVCKRWLRSLRGLQTSLRFSIPTDLVSINDATPPSSSDSSSSPATFDLDNLNSVLAHRPHIVSLTVTSKPHTATAEYLSSQVMCSIASFCKHLKELCFTAGPPTISSLKDLAAGSPGLVTLELLQPQSLGCLPILAQFKSLQELYIRGQPEDVVSCVSLHDDDLSLPSCYGSLNLVKLCFINVRSNSGCDLSWLWRSCTSRLRNVEFLRCDDVASSMSAFVHCMPWLHEVKLCRCRAIAGRVLELVSEYSPELRGLTVHDGADTRCLLQVIQKCRALEALDLRLPLDLSNEDLMEIAQLGRQFKSLRLHSCWLTTGADMRALASSITSDRLEELALIKCRAIVQDSGGLSALGQSLGGRLKIIDLSENEHLAEQGLAAMLASCHAVRQLRLSKCGRLSDKVMEFIGNRCHHLESMDIMRCEGVSTAGVSSLLKLQCCPNLKTLKVEPQKLTKDARKLASMKGVTLSIIND